MEGEEQTEGEFPAGGAWSDLANCGNQQFVSPRWKHKLKVIEQVGTAFAAFRGEHPEQPQDEREDGKYGEQDIAANFLGPINQTVSSNASRNPPCQLPP